MNAQMEEIKALIKSYKRSSSSSRRRSRAHASELPSPARSHRHRQHHHHEREGQELNTNNRSTTSPSPLASSPSDLQASLPWDIRHLHPQEPQEKLPKLKSATSMSYYDLDTDHKIPFYGTQEPEEYLEWERLMDDYLKLHQVPPEDQVKCATRNFHDYASKWWLHTPSESYDMSWPKTKRALR